MTVGSEKPLRDTAALSATYTGAEAASRVCASLAHPCIPTHGKEMSNTDKGGSGVDKVFITVLRAIQNLTYISEVMEGTT